MNPVCREYTAFEVFKYNYLIWGIAFFLGLQFTHLDDGPLKKIEFNPEVMKTWGAGLWAFFIALCVLIVGVVLVVCRRYIELGIMKYYIIWATFLFTALIWNTKREAKLGKHIHIHHYNIAYTIL